MRPGITVAFATRTYSPRIGRYIRRLKQSAGLSRIEVLFQLNSGQQSLAAVYNQFLSQARFDVICLVHDDLRFERYSHWAVQVLEAFQRFQNYAVLSAAGSVSLDSDGVYWLPRTEMLGRVTHLLPRQKYLSDYSGSFSAPLPALVLDGLFLAVHRQRLTYGFDEELKGFHFYDIGLSLRQSLAHQQGRGGACGVLTRLAISHASTGQPDRQYEFARQVFVRRYRSLLPAYLLPDLQIPVLPRKSQAADLVVLLWDSNPSMRLEALWPVWPDVPIYFFSPREPSPNWPANLKHFPISAIQTWHGLIPIFRACLQQIKVESVLFWETRVQALQPGIISEMQRRLLQSPGCGSLGLRLHYADSHLLYCNGLELHDTKDGYELIQRGIHRPYAYTLKAEPVVANLASAMLTPRKLFLDNAGFHGSDWVPGFFYGLRLSQQGYFHQLDSRWVAYWHEEPQHSDPFAENAYQQFQSDLRASLHQIRPTSNWSYLIKKDNTVG